MTRRTSVILLFALLASACAASSADDTGAKSKALDAGFVPLFNGQDLTGWTHATKAGEGYRVRTYEVRQGNSIAKEGVIYCTVKDGGNLFTEQTYADFVLRLEFKLTPGANNGVAIRAPMGGQVAYKGMEIQVLDDTAEKHAKLRPTQYCGSVYNIAAAERGHLKPVGEWNEQEITARGSRITVTLNGAKVTEIDLATVTDEKVIAKHPGIKNNTGHIGFLGHGAEVEFRNIFIKPL